jgi:centrosomal protein CEP104
LFLKTRINDCRNCSYPQHITFQLESATKLQQLQLLSHEFKIAGKVELQISNSPPTQQGTQFTRLGFLHFDSNERTNFSARELKSISLPNTEALLLRLLFHRVHSNPLNIHNQVALITVDVVGVPVDSRPVAVDSKPLLPRLGVLSLHSESATPLVVVDSVTAEKIDKLQLQKAEAVSREDYDLAKRLKGAIDRLRIAGTKIAALESKKKEAVEVEDYDTAKALKTEIERARAKAYDAAHIFQEPKENLDDNAIKTTTAQHEKNAESIEKVSRTTSASPLSLEEILPKGLPIQSRSPQVTPSPAVVIGEVMRSANDGEVDVMDGEDASQGPPRPDDFPEGLPVPEALQRTETSDALESLVGEYLARCLHSKTWQLREAALSYLVSHWSKSFESKVRESATKAECVRAVTVAISQSIRSRVPGLVATALRLFRIVVSSTPVCDISPQQLQSIVSEMIPVMVDRAAEAGPRSREKEQVLETLIHLCDIPASGMKSQQSLANQLLTTPSPRKSHQQNKSSRTKGQSASCSLPPKAMLARIQLIISLLPVIGVAGCVAGGSGGFPPESVLRFAMPGLKSSSAEVRAAAAELTMQVGRATGTASTVLSALPSDINPKLREQMEAGLGVGSVRGVGADGNGDTATPVTSATTNTSASIAAGRKPKLVRAQAGQQETEPHSKPQSQSKSRQQSQQQVPADSTPVITRPAHYPPSNREQPHDDSSRMLPDEAVFQDPAPFEEEYRERERRYGPQHPAVAEAASNLAIVYNQCGEPGRALPLYRRALEIWEAVYGAFHPDVAHTLTDIAVILLEHGRDDDGRALLSRALEIQTELLGEDHPDCVAIRDVLEEMQLSN